MTLTLGNLDAKYHELFELLGARKAQVLAFKDYIVSATKQSPRREPLSAG